jgi:hypothetical protein
MDCAISSNPAFLGLEVRPGGDHEVLRSATKWPNEGSRGSICGAGRLVAFRVDAREERSTQLGYLRACGCVRIRREGGRGA